MSEDKRLPFQDTPELNQEQDDARGEQFWEHIAELLEQIEENTRGGADRGTPTAAAATPARPKEETGAGKKDARGQGAAQGNAAVRTTARTASAERRPSRSIIPLPAALVDTPQPRLQSLPENGQGKAKATDLGMNLARTLRRSKKDPAPTSIPLPKVRKPSRKDAKKRLPRSNPRASWGH